MPMAGAGSRFFKNGYMLPKPLIEIEKRPFFYWATRSVEKFIDISDLTFIVLKEHITGYSLDKLIYSYFPKAKVVVLPKVTSGSVSTCLEGINGINDDLPLLFNDCDHLFKCSKMNSLFRVDSGNIDLDGGLVCFKSNIPHFSYIKYDENGKIIGTAEKQVVSDNAICGAYLYKNAKLFREIAEEYLRDCPYKESFLSGMYNVMCSHNMRIKDFLLDYHVEFGTPEEYEKAKGSSYFKELL